LNAFVTFAILFMEVGCGAGKGWRSVRQIGKKTKKYCVELRRNGMSYIQ
jgi:hypothetical protein